MPIPGWLRRHGDVALAVLLAIAMEIDVLRLHRGGDEAWGLLLGLVATLPLALRRRLALASFVVVRCGLFGLQMVASPVDQSSVAFFTVHFVSLYSVGAYAAGREAWAAGCLIVVSIALFVANDGDPFAWGDVPFGAVLVGGPWAAGLAIRLRRERESLLTARTTALEQEQEALAQQAVAEERARIARELHDVVSHAISVTVLQARGGRRMLGTDDATAREAFDAIERINEQALGDMRRMLSLIRETDDDVALTPQPSLSRLPCLVEELRASGLTVDLDVRGDAAAVPPGVGLSAYRIVQEALTNVLRHAGTTRARVEVSVREHDVEVCVTDEGTGTGSLNGTGHGLIGIRERVSVVGGEVDVGARPEGGFRVRARLPYVVES